jgi:hypothetical protein
MTSAHAAYQGIDRRHSLGDPQVRDLVEYWKSL